MRGWLRRFSAFLLSVCLFTTGIWPAFSAVSAAESGTQEGYEAAYLAQLDQRYVRYLESSYSFAKLVESQNYLHCTWADDIEYKTEWVSPDYYAGEKDNFWNKLLNFFHAAGHNVSASISSSVLWATHYLTDTKLDQAAYEDCLAQILAMHEKGFLETVQQQAEFDVSGGNDALSGAMGLANVGWLSLKTAYKISGVKLFGDLVDEKTEKSLEQTMKKLQLTVDSLSLAKDMTLDGADAFSVAIYTNLHKERMMFLEAVRDNADPKTQKKLIRAAENMIDVANVRFSGFLFSLGNTDNTVKLADLTANLGSGKGLDDFADRLGSYVSQAAEGFTSRFLAGSKGAESLCKKVKFLGGNVSLIMAGMEIGGSIGNLLWGDALELFREMLIMDDVGSVLEKAITDCADRCSQDNRDENWYNSLYELVAVGESLCYVRSCGEYAAMNYMKWLRESKEKEQEWYRNMAEASDFPEERNKMERRAEALGNELQELASDEELNVRYAVSSGMLIGCYRALAAIFPSEESRVIVHSAEEAWKGQTAGQTVLYRGLKPRVIIPGNPEAAEKINGSGEISSYYESIQNRIGEGGAAEQVSGNAQEGWQHLIEAGAARIGVSGDGLGIQMDRMEVSYNSAHPMHYVYTMNFDLSTGEFLTLQDVLLGENPEKEKKELGKLLTEALNAELNGYSLTGKTEEEIIEEFVLQEPNAHDRDHRWFFDQDGFSVIFDLYAIVPYAGGTPVITVPYSSLGGILKEEYLPEDRRDTWTDGAPVIALKEEIQQERGSERAETEYGDPEKSLNGIISHGTVYDVTVNYQWNSLLFYASVMTEEDVLWLEDQGRERTVLEIRYLAWDETAVNGQRTEETLDLSVQ